MILGTKQHLIMCKVTYQKVSVHYRKHGHNRKTKLFLKNTKLQFEGTNLKSSIFYKENTRVALIGAIKKQINVFEKLSF